MASKKTATYDVDYITVLAYNPTTKAHKEVQVKVPEIIKPKERDNFINKQLEDGFIKAVELSTETHKHTMALDSVFFWEHATLVSIDGEKVKSEGV